LVALANQLADAEQQPRSSVEVAYFQTSEGTTASLEALIAANTALEAEGKTPDYWVTARDCNTSCALALSKTGVILPFDVIPNMRFFWDWAFSQEWARGSDKKEDQEKDRKPSHDKKLIPRDNSDDDGE
jgi:hypothetical protein